jgi:magnesium transporter
MPPAAGGRARILQMIHYYYRNKDEHILEQRDEFVPGAWTYVENPSVEERQFLVERFGLSPRFLEDALDREEIPRLEIEDGHTYIFSRFAYRTSKATINTVPVLFVINKNSLFTVTAKELPALDTLISSTHVEAVVSDPAVLMIRLLHEINVHYDSFISDSNKQIRRLREHLGKRDVGPKDFIQFVTLEDDLNDFLSSLEPTNAALRRLINGKHDAFTRYEELVETVILNNEESIRTCNSSLKALGSIRRTYTLIGSHNLDKTIKVLTVAALLIAIPNMFFGMYGMNVHLPFQQEPWTFQLVTGVSVLAILFVLIYGKRRRLF